MNIFELYLDKIKSTIVDLQKKDELIIPDTLNGISAEIPPAKFDCDIFNQCCYGSFKNK
jgi:arginyl-tRNA synthetase